MTRPPVSVAMATYNGAEHVEVQLESILRQLSGRDEVVVVDDASTDSTVRLIRELADPRVVLTESHVNRGYVATFEAALSRCSHDHVFLADQDDVWPDGRVDELVDALERRGVVAGNLLRLDTGRSILSPIRRRPWTLRARESNRRAQNLGRILAGIMPYFGSAMAVRRDALDRVLPFPPWLDESHDLWIAVVGNIGGSMQHVETAVTLRRYHESNASPDRPRGIVPVLRARWLIIRMMWEARRRWARS